MRGKNLNCGIRGGLWDEAHLQRMGPAVWLFGWLVHRQTRERNGVGLVLGGSPLTYRMIQDDTGYARRTLQRWMADLRRAGYVRVRRTCHSRMVIEVLKAKKFGAKQLGFPQGSFFAPNSSAPTVAEKVASSAPVVAHKNAGCTQQAAINAMSYVSARSRHRQYEPERQINNCTHCPTHGVKVSDAREPSPRENSSQSFSQENANGENSGGAAKAARDFAASHSFASSGGGQNREEPRAYAPSEPYRSGQNSRALREAILRAELRVGAGPEVRRE